MESKEPFDLPHYVIKLRTSVKCECLGVGPNQPISRLTIEINDICGEMYD